MLSHNYIGTEHLLLGLISEEHGVAAKALESLNISLEAAIHEVERSVGRGQASPAGRIPFTPRAKKVLELSLRESRQLGHRHIGTEHLLLGLAREGEGEGAQILQELGAGLAQVHQVVLGLLPAGTEGPPADVVGEEADPARGETPRTADPAMRFQEREKIVLSLMLEGLNNRQIAETLGVSTTTVTEIIRRIIEKLEKASEGEGDGP
jgi:ATP-dependent Clp protease ATP-binding subunit ClpC